MKCVSYTQKFLIFKFFANLPNSERNIQFMWPLIGQRVWNNTSCTAYHYNNYIHIIILKFLIRIQMNCKEYFFLLERLLWCKLLLWNNSRRLGNILYYTYISYFKISFKMSNLREIKRFTFVKTTLITKKNSIDNFFEIIVNDFNMFDSNDNFNKI